MVVVAAPAVAASMEIPEVGTSSLPDTLTKSDRLPVTYISSVEPLATELQMPPEPPSNAIPMIISRHWHDPKIAVLRAACNPDESSPLRGLFGAATTCSN